MFQYQKLGPIYPKSMKLSHMTSLNVMLHVVVAVYRLGKIWNSPQLPAQFRNGLRPKHPPLLVCLSVVRRHKHPHDPQSYAGWSVTLLTVLNIQLRLVCG